MVRLTNRQLSELQAARRMPGIWRGVEPANADVDLRLYLANGLVHHIGFGQGYAITPAGRQALEAHTEVDNG